MTDVGFPALMAKALEATAELPDRLVTMGFSNGAGSAECVAASRPGAIGVVMMAGALDPAELGITWPKGVPGQIHTTVDDPWREQAAGGRVEAHDYPAPVICSPTRATSTSTSPPRPT